MAPLEAAQTSLDIHNAAGQWNKALLDNAARPSGALVYSAAGQNLTGEQFGRLKEELEENFSGATNAGRPMLLEGGLDWKTIALSPRDMDFIEAKHAAARDIALAFGVPPMLLGIPGDNTYANLAEANRALWRQTLIPLVVRVAEELSNWLSPGFGGAVISPDFDGVEALAEDRAALWTRVGGAEFLSDAEKRAMLGV
jgi:HK97 family phage portal protein